MAAEPAHVPGSARAWLTATLAVTVGSVATAVALAPSGPARAPEELAVLLFVGSSVHVASTGWFYTVPAVRRHMRTRKARYLWWPLTLVTGAAAIAVLVPAAALWWLLVPYFCWQFWHYQKQNLGIAALAAAALRLGPPHGRERRALLASGLATAAALACRPAQLQLPVRAAALTAVFPLAALAFAVSVLAGVLAFAQRSRTQRPASFAVAYLASLTFGLPVFVSPSPFASVAGLTIAHGLQYLLLMGLTAAGGGRGTRSVQLAALGNVALLGGAVLALASDHRVDLGGGRVLFGLFSGVVMAHFVIDGGLWRMREEFPRRFLAERLPYLVPAAAGGQ